MGPPVASGADKEGGEEDDEEEMSVRTEGQAAVAPGSIIRQIGIERADRGGVGRGGHGDD